MDASLECFCFELYHALVSWHSLQEQFLTMYMMRPNGSYLFEFFYFCHSFKLNSNIINIIYIDQVIYSEEQEQPMCAIRKDFYTHSRKAVCKH